MTTAPAPNVLSVDDLAANRSGRLTEHQRSAWMAYQRASTDGFLIGAVAFAGIGVATLLGLGGGIGSLTNLVATAGCFVLAVFLAWNSIVPRRRLARDLAEGRLETIEGPIERRRTDRTYGSTPRNHHLYVHGRAYQVTRSDYEAAPLMGPVRLYALPRSHKVIGLEPGGDGDVRGGATALTASPGYVGQGDGRPLETAILGTWRGQDMTATFSPDGTARARMRNGMELSGQWSVGGNGGFHFTGLGQDTPAQVVIDGDALEIRMDGMRLPFRREA
jgi:hypothetical protein